MNEIWHKRGEGTGSGGMSSNKRKKDNNNDDILIFLFSLFFSFILYFAASSILFPKGNIFINDLKENIQASVFRISKYGDADDYEVSKNYSLKLNEENLINISSENDFDPQSQGFEQRHPKDNNSIGDLQVIPGGMTIGVRINTEGIMVLGIGYVNSDDGIAYKPSEGYLKPGDMVLTVNGQALTTKEEFAREIEEAEEKLYMKIKREGEIQEVTISPVKSMADGKNKIGVWVRDSTQGIGTVTYYDPATQRFAALGHGILDVDTKKLMTVRDGEVMGTEIKSVRKGKKGSPGELVGEIRTHEVIGNVKLNNEFGLYGRFNEDISYKLSEPMNIAKQDEVEEGNAYILSNIEGTEIKQYKVQIEAVNKNSSDDSKGMVLRIVDEELLSKTNGIVQGMSGSPIIQNGKLIGAVTHVFVQEPAKGYGIFIEKMINQEKTI